MTISCDIGLAPKQTVNQYKLSSLYGQCDIPSRSSSRKRRSEPEVEDLSKISITKTIKISSKKSNEKSNSFLNHYFSVAFIFIAMFLLLWLLLLKIPPQWWWHHCMQNIEKIGDFINLLFSESTKEMDPLIKPKW